MTTHREAYPEQYRHSLVGETVQVFSKSTGSLIVRGTVERVVASRFGQLAKIAGARDGMFYAVRDCHIAPKEFTLDLTSARLRPGSGETNRNQGGRHG